MAVKNQITPQVLRELRNLLARVHRDGGHHTEEVGLLRSIRDAEDVYLKMRNDLADLTGDSYFV